jgi:hypothetical protein
MVGVAAVGCCISHFDSALAQLHVLGFFGAAVATRRWQLHARCCVIPCIHVWLQASLLYVALQCLLPVSLCGRRYTLCSLAACCAGA